MASSNNKLISIIKNKVPGGIREDIISTNQSHPRKIYITKFGLDGLNDMFEYSKMSEFYRYLEYPPHETINDTKNYILSLINRINNGYHNGMAMYWFIRDLETKKVIGSIGLIGIDFDRKVSEIGMGISPKYWGKGHIFEALWLLLDYCINDLSMERLSAMTREDNNSVIKTFEIAGFKQEGRLRQADCHYTGKRHDTIILGLLKKEENISRLRALTKIFSN